MSNTGFKIGDFSKISRVSVKTLRYYDEVGLLKPSQIDRFTSYRYYTVDQLPRLNRILALKDLGFSLEQIARLLDESVSLSELRGMLRLKQNELQQQVEEQQARLTRIEARLRQIEQEATMSNTDVVIKSIEPQTVSYVHEVIPSLDQFGQLIGRAFAQLGQQGLRPAGAPFALYYDTEFHEQNIDVEIAIPVGAAPAGSLSGVRQMPGGTVACLVHQGAYDTIGSAYAALISWIESNGYRITGACREIYLRGPESGNDPASYVTEIQFPVEKN